MRFRLLVLAAALAVAGVLTLQPLADGANPSLSFRVVEGPSVTVPGSSVTDAQDYDVRCPRGYVATGYGVSLGSTQLVFADPDAGGRGFSFAFLNNEAQPAPNVGATVICMRGRGISVRAASLSLEDRRQAVEQARKALQSR